MGILSVFFFIFNHSAIRPWKYPFRSWKPELIGFHSGCSKPSIRPWKPPVRPWKPPVMPWKPSLIWVYSGHENLHSGLGNFHSDHRNYQPGLRNLQPGLKNLQPGLWNLQLSFKQSIQGLRATYHLNLCIQGPHTTNLNLQGLRICHHVPLIKPFGTTSYTSSQPLKVEILL